MLRQTKDNWNYMSCSEAEKVNLITMSVLITFCCDKVLECEMEKSSLLHGSVQAEKRKLAGRSTDKITPSKDIPPMFPPSRPHTLECHSSMTSSIVQFFEKNSTFTVQSHLSNATRWGPNYDLWGFIGGVCISKPQWCQFMIDLSTGWVKS